MSPLPAPRRPVDRLRPLAVLGGSGFLGTQVVSAAVRAARGTEVLTIDRGAGEAPPGARRVRLDAGEPDLLEQALERERPGGVVLCAALARAGDCEQRPALAWRLNVDLPARVARWCAAHGARLVHVSTDLVFGREEPPPGGFPEDHPPGPLGVYGTTKAAGEAAVLAVDPGALVVRLPLLYGDAGGRGRGASEALLAACERGERPLLFTDEWRTPLEVGHAARALVELVGRGSPRGLLHVAGPQRVSRYELGLAILEAAGHSRAAARALVRAGTRAQAGLAASRARDVSLDCARARALLATPLPGLAAGLRRPPP